MKVKLIELGLSEDLVDKILDVFDTYKKTLERYSKPKGPMAFQDNMKEIESVSKKLQKRLDKLTIFEKQLLNQICPQKIFELKTSLILLSFSCQEARKKRTRFSRKEPFILSLTIDLWKILESNGITVKKYKNNILCQILNALLPESEKPRKHKKDESEMPADLWAFHLLREASKYFPKN